MTRGLQVLLCALVLVLTSTPAWAHGRPENRVWGFSEKPADFAAQETAKPIDTPGENPGCGYDFASGVHKYLYCQNNPVNRIDPSGNDDFTLPSLSLAGGMSAGIDALGAGTLTRAFAMAMFQTITAAIAIDEVVQLKREWRSSVFRYDPVPGKTFFPIGTYVTDNPSLSWSQAVNITFFENMNYLYVYQLTVRPADLGPALNPVMGVRQWQLENTVYNVKIIRTLSKEGGGSSVF